MALTTRKSLVVVAAASLFIAILWLVGLGFGHEVRLSRWLGHPFLGSTVYFGTWFVFVTTLVAGVGIPLLTVRFAFLAPLSEYGFSLGDSRRGIVWLLVLAPAYMLVPLVSASIGTERYYTYLVETGFLTPLNVALHCASYGMFAFGFESLFRGFVLFGLVNAFGNSLRGRWAAIIIAALLSAACLAGLPWVFPVSALVAGIPAGFLSLRLQSFFYFAFIHWNIGIWSDVWEILKLNVAHRIC